MNQYGNKSDDTTLLYLALAAIAVCFAWYLWYVDHGMISYYGAAWSWYQLTIFDHSFMPAIIKEWQNQAFSLAARANDVTFDELTEMLNKVGYLYVALPLVFTVKHLLAQSHHPAVLTRRRITLDSLPQIMSVHSPAIIPLLCYPDLLQNDPPEHRSSINPEEWVKEHGLLVSGSLERSRCKALLVSHLGPRISSIDEMQPHEKALFAVFASRVFKTENGFHAQTILDALNRSCFFHTWNGMRGYPDLTIADEAYAFYSNHIDVAKWINTHNYARTLLHVLHAEAIKSGKLPSAQFRWLKGMDRGLWYALNTTGRKAPFLESSAVFTQTLWEKFAAQNQFSLPEPHLDDAIDGIEAYLIKLGLIVKKKGFAA